MGSGVLLNYTASIFGTYVFSKNDYGMFILLLSWMVMIFSIYSLGIHNAIIKKINYYKVNNAEKVRSSIDTAIKTVFIGGIIVSILIAFILFGIDVDDSYQELILSFCLLGIVYGIGITLSKAFQGLNKPYVALLLSNTSYYSAMLLSFLITWLLNLSLIETILLFAICYVLVVISSIVYLCKICPKYVGRITKLGSFGYKYLAILTTSSVLSYGTNNGMLIALGYIGNIQEVAIFAVNYNLSKLPFLIHVLTTTLFNQKFSLAYEKGEIEIMRSLYKRHTKISIALSSILILFIYIFSDVIFSFYNKGYIDKNLFYLLLLGTWFQVSCGPVDSILWLSKYAKIEMYNLLLQLSVQIILGVLLYSLYGLIGLACGIVAGIVLVQITRMIQSHLTLRISLLS